MIKDDREFHKAHDTMKYIKEPYFIVFCNCEKLYKGTSLVDAEKVFDNLKKTATESDCLEFRIFEKKDIH